MIKDILFIIGVLISGLVIILVCRANWFPHILGHDEFDDLCDEVENRAYSAQTRVEEYLNGSRR